MKTTGWFLLIVMIGFSLRSQTVISSCTAADSIVKKYRKSADKLAVRRVEYLGHPYKDSIVINKQISGQYLKALLAVYNATTLPARDTIVAFGIVLDYYSYNLNSLTISADSTKPWAKNLRDKILPCGNTDLDFFITKYHLRVSGYFPSFLVPTYMIMFETDTNYHIYRLCQKFDELKAQGVGCNSTGWLISDSFKIKDSVNSNFIEFTYSLGWGDCLSLCIYFRHWVFRVYDDCSVEYKGSYGEALTFSPFTGIIENKNRNGRAKILPNPTGDKLFIRLEDIENYKVDVEISNAQGIIVYQHNSFDSGQQFIDVSTFSDGIYFVRLTFDNKSLVKKIIVVN